MDGPHNSPQPHNSQLYGYHFEQPPTQYGHNPHYPYLDVYPNIYHPYDPITGEYIKPIPLQASHRSKQYKSVAQTLVSTPRTAYADDESEEQLLCSDCCRTGIPVNCLTVSLCINLVLIALFALIKYRFIDGRATTTTTSALIEDIIFALLFCAIILLIIIFIRYAFSEKHRRVVMSFLQCQYSNDTMTSEDQIRRNQNNYIVNHNFSANSTNEQFV